MWRISSLFYQWAKEMLLKHWLNLITEQIISANKSFSLSLNRFSQGDNNLLIEIGFIAGTIHYWFIKAIEHSIYYDTLEYKHVEEIS